MRTLATWLLALLLASTGNRALAEAPGWRCPGIEGVMPKGDSSWWRRGDVAVPLRSLPLPAALAARGNYAARFAPGPGGLRRIVIWGDSHLAGGGVRDALELALARRGLSSDASFLPPYLTKPGVRLPLRRFCVGRAWRAEFAYAAQVSGDYGPALAQLRAAASRSESYLWLDLRSAAGFADVTRARLLVRALRDDSEIAVAQDGGVERRIALGASAGLSVPIDLVPRLGLLSDVRLRVTRGEVAWLGLSMQRGLPAAVTIDVLAIPGATIDGLLASPATLLAEDFGQGLPDAVVLAFGTNEAANRFDETDYRQRLRRALTSLQRAAPGAACLLIGAPDRGLNPQDRPSRGRAGLGLEDPRHNARIHARVNAIQAEVAAQFGCAAWDWQAAMGGVGSAGRWQAMQPPWFAADRIHLTQAGYRISGAMLAAWLGWAPQESAPSPCGPGVLACATAPLSGGDTKPPGE